MKRAALSHFRASLSTLLSVQSEPGDDFPNTSKLTMFASSGSKNHISEIKKSNWEYIGPSTLRLNGQLTSLYWDGVRQELENVLFTLKKFHEPKYEKLWKDEEDETIDGLYGFETFVGQVSQKTHSFYSNEYAKSKKSWNVKDRLTSTYEDGIYLKIKSLETEHASDKLKSAIKTDMQRSVERNRLDPAEKLAKMLLRSSGFLDIEKIIEHRPVLPGFWKTPTIPQMSLDRFSETQQPVFSPRKCPECNQTIHGTMFIPQNSRGDSRTYICEQCYRQAHYGDKSYVKVPKHCVFAEAISDKKSREICQCPGVPHFDERGNPRQLFPVDRREPHIDEGPNTCGLLQLNEQLARAKYATIAKQPGRKKRAIIKNFFDFRPSDEKPTNRKRDEDDDDWEDEDDGPGFSMVASTLGVSDQEQGDSQIPFFLRPIAQNYTFGNVHMALRVGPLIIENGVSNTKGGALITLRNPPRLFRESKPRPNRMLAVGGSNGRPLYTQANDGDRSQPKRIKAIMKQVVGWPFARASESARERRFIRDLVQASKLERLYDPSLSRAERQQNLDGVLGFLLDQLKTILQDRLQLYLKDLALRLAHPEVRIRWDATRNNCQNFCDSLLSQRRFQSLVDQRRSKPRYLMSFVCRPGAYQRIHVRTKFDVPNGLTEEYLLKFRHGLHEESDIVDSLQEYWHDWGAFGRPIYRFQDLFPWDCSEAFGRHPVACSNCNISKHVWAFPFDSWSIISHHLARDRCLYTTHGADGSPKPLSDADWLRNRLTLFKAEDALSAAAAAMAQNNGFRQATQWLLQQPYHDIDRMKLGGIHRAQPWSSFFMKDAYNHFFIARWAHFRREDQITAYEMLRNYRMEMVEVGVTTRRWAGGHHAKGGDAGVQIDPGNLGACGTVCASLADADSLCAAGLCGATATLCAGGNFASCANGFCGGGGGGICGGAAGATGCGGGGAGGSSGGGCGGGGVG
ncbi:hypothetical protein HDK90DRAFT_494035 [Phyllosticta capitalensis]|uniref:Uncharacterized protein n=1 Tax=Phyllosticta capitalensis TaxID=121624 RepID=A0ABR1YDL6_9PEZI